MIRRPSIREWAVDDRPREKFLSQGAAALSDDELLAILIGSGSGQLSAVGLARSLIDYAGGNLTELSRMSVGRLQQINGIGFSKAVTIAAALELGRRRQADSIPRDEKIIGSMDIAAMFIPLLSDLPYEEVWVVLLSSSKKILEKYRLSSGGSVNSPIDSRLIMRRALDRVASGLVLVHNHPSGDTLPSEYDITATRQLKNAAAFFDIRLLDHIVVGDGKSFSFAEKGLL